MIKPTINCKTRKLGNKVDFVISAGPACRPAHYTRLLDMRKFSSPCDWMMCYSLDVFLDVLTSEAKYMFLDAYIDHKNRWVVDKGSGMISMHDFSCDLPLEEQLPAFYKKMQSRGRKTLHEMMKCKRVGIVMNRNISYEELLQFSEKLAIIFPQCHFCVVNMKDCPHMHSIDINQYEQRKQLSVYEICFDDGHPEGRDMTKNPLFWLGNTEVWLDILPRVLIVRGAFYGRMKMEIKAGIRKFINAARRVRGFCKGRKL